MSKENKAIQKQWDFPIKVDSYDKNAHTITVVITSSSIDHDNEIVNPAGMYFRKQPKGLYGHNSSIPAVTRIEWIKYDANLKAILAKILFDQNDPFSVLLENKYAGGFMTDVSIGFIPDSESMTVEADTGIMIFNKWELLEVSLVNLGCNLDAIALSMDECDVMIKSYDSSPETKSQFEGLKDRLLVKSLDEGVKDIKKELEKIPSLNTEVENIKSAIDKLKQSDDKDVEKLIAEEVGKINSKIDLLVKEISNIKIENKKKELEVRISNSLNAKRGCVVVQ